MLVAALRFEFCVSAQYQELRSWFFVLSTRCVCAAITRYLVSRSFLTRPCVARARSGKSSSALRDCVFAAQSRSLLRVSQPYFAWLGVRFGAKHLVFVSSCEWRC